MHTLEHADRARHTQNTGKHRDKENAKPHKIPFPLVTINKVLYSTK